MGVILICQLFTLLLTFVSIKNVTEAYYTGLPVFAFSGNKYPLMRSVCENLADK